jgi:uncharacterized protein with PIN domain
MGQTNDARSETRCSVCGAALASVDVRMSPHRIWPGHWEMVEETIICEAGHRVMRLTKTPRVVAV